MAYRNVPNNTNRFRGATTSDGQTDMGHLIMPEVSKRDTRPPAYTDSQRLKESLEEVTEWRHLVNMKFLLLDDSWLKFSKSVDVEKDPKQTDFHSILDDMNVDKNDLTQKVKRLNGFVPKSERLKLEKECFSCFRIVLEKMVNEKGYELADLLR